MKQNKIIIGVIIVLLIVIVLLLLQRRDTVAETTLPSQGSEQSGSGDVDTEAQNEVFTPNEDGLIEIVLPQNLFGGKDTTADDFIEDYLGTEELQQLVSNVTANDDGSATVFFTPEGLSVVKQNMYEGAQYHNLAGIESIKNVVFEDELLTEITVSVDTELYQQNGFERQMCNSLLAMDTGTYQVLSGVAPDEWHTRVTIKDVDTGEIISVREYPSEDMYDMR